VSDIWLTAIGCKQLAKEEENWDPVDFRRTHQLSLFPRQRHIEGCRLQVNTGNLVFRASTEARSMSKGVEVRRPAHYTQSA